MVVGNHIKHLQLIFEIFFEFVVAEQWIASPYCTMQRLERRQVG
jgi:hypothetical protein